TADEIADPQALELSTRLNGELVQNALAAEMIYTIAEQIVYASQITTLEPGDVIATGSPDGTGGSRTPRRFLRAGDRLEVSVSGVGTLMNDVGGLD
ncbi:MAG: fumarylacetoacetate hydrolase family protein, partial [Paracoccaceae bacterium]|nr:fumarylacetoacetate hydrolase family protein [Paracoccaceae bacterium]